MEYDAEILIQDVNAKNSAIYEDCWVYVSKPETKKAPLYFAPYFTRENPIPGIKYISRVLNVQDTNLPDHDTIPSAPSVEHRERWTEGLRLLRQRTKDEGWSGKARLFYLDRPIVFTETPLTKQSFNAGGAGKKMTSQVPTGFSLRFDELLRNM